MDRNSYIESTMEMAMGRVMNHVIHGVECCAMQCDNVPEAAYELSFDEHSTMWIHVCELCQEDKKNASYWWNKALRGESFDDEEE